MLSGDTMIPLCNGEHAALRVIAERGQPVKVWSLDLATKTVVQKDATARVTRATVPEGMLLVTIEGNDEIECTPDQQLLLADGGWLEVKALRPGDHLMPFLAQRAKDQPRRDGLVEAPSAHLVASVVQLLTKTGPAYCFTVAGLENFAVSADVFAHS